MSGPETHEGSSAQTACPQAGFKTGSILFRRAMRDNPIGNNRDSFRRTGKVVRRTYQATGRRTASSTQPASALRNQGGKSSSMHTPAVLGWRVRNVWGEGLFGGWVLEKNGGETEVFTNVGRLYRKKKR